MDSEMLSNSNMYFWEDKRRLLNKSDNYTDSYMDYYYDITDNETALFSRLPDFMVKYDAFHYSVHAYLCLIVIIFGTFTNIINMIVYTRKNMISSINMILTALSLADMMVLITYLVKIQYHSPVHFMTYTEYTYPLAVFCLFLKNSYVVAHAISVWLTVVAAIWRVMGVCYSIPTARWRTPWKATIAIVSTYIACTLICIPEYLMYKIQEKTHVQTTLQYEIAVTDTYLQNNDLFDWLETWVFNVILKLVPCVPLTVLTLMLVWTIYKGNKSRQKLNVRSDNAQKSRDRTTKMLIIILILFLLIKIPPGIMYILDFGLGIKYVGELNFVFSGTVNFLILVNSAVNFIVYCSMSAQFRGAIVDTFHKAVEKLKNIRIKQERVPTSRAKNIPKLPTIKTPTWGYTFDLHKDKLYKGLIFI